MILALVFAPLIAGLLCLLLQRGFRSMPVLTYLFTGVVGLSVLIHGVTLQLHLVDSFGISLLFDPDAAWFLLLNAVVSSAVVWHERSKGRHHYFFILLAILHGCLNACFLSVDLFNLYVVIELTTIIAFLLVGQGMKTRHLWNGLRYLFLSNVGMLFFLLGTLLVYESSGDFSLTSVVEAPPIARALIVTGLLVKGGVFMAGLWLPQAHAEAETGVSAMLSGVVVKIGVLPLIRLESSAPDLEAIIRLLGIGGVILGLGLAFCQRDIKRLLACSTISQVGFILVSPAIGAVYAFTHGVAKACLFLCVSGLPDRDLLNLREKRVSWPIAWPMTLAAVSIAGCPLLIGFHAKYEVLETLSGWLYWVMSLASVGTAALLAPLVLLPRKSGPWRDSSTWQAPLLLGVLLLLCGIYAGPYKAEALIKAGGTLIVGLLLHISLLKRLMIIELPRGWEKLEHVVGMTCCILLYLFMAVYLP